jgi:ABC-2 type transport system ATP-binding protein
MNTTVATDTAIQVRGLEKTFRNFHLGPLDLTVPRGAIYGLIGPNGAGKTTTIDLMLGMGREEAGTIRILGFDHRRDEVDVKRRVGYVSPDLSYQPWGKVSRAVNFVRAFYPDWDDDYCRRLFESLQVNWDEKIASLSYGAKTKLALIMALSHRPDVLILDEPTAGLDAHSKRQLFTELLAAVENSDRTVFISSHSLSDLERFADHIGIIHHGRLLLEGPTAELVDRYRQVDFILRGGLQEKIAEVQGVLLQARDGDRYRALVDVTGPALDRLKSLGADQIAATPVTLEDMFIGLTQG